MQTAGCFEFLDIENIEISGLSIIRKIALNCSLIKYSNDFLQNASFKVENSLFEQISITQSL